MIDRETKKKFLKELERSGNISYACAKLGIGRESIYRWKKTDKAFKKEYAQSYKIGRENLCDLAEHALTQKVREKDMNAIKYTLSHNSPIYKPKRTSTVIIKHQSDKVVPEVNALTLDQLEELARGDVTTIDDPEIPELMEPEIIGQEEENDESHKDTHATLIRPSQKPHRPKKKVKFL